LRRLNLEILQCRDAHIQRNHVKLEFNTEDREPIE
jgi:hypothetical protein